jgi:hypothetical protein
MESLADSDQEVFSYSKEINQDVMNYVFVRNKLLRDRAHRSPRNGPRNAFSGRRCLSEAELDQLRFVNPSRQMYQGSSYYPKSQSIDGRLENIRNDEMPTFSFRSGSKEGLSEPTRDSGIQSGLSFVPYADSPSARVQFDHRARSRHESFSGQMELFPTTDGRPPLMVSGEIPPLKNTRCSILRSYLAHASREHFRSHPQNTDLGDENHHEKSPTHSKCGSCDSDGRRSDMESGHCSACVPENVVHKCGSSEGLSQNYAHGNDEFMLSKRGPSVKDKGCNCDCQNELEMRCGCAEDFASVSGRSNQEFGGIIHPLTEISLLAFQESHKDGETRLKSHDGNNSRKTTSIICRLTEENISIHNYIGFDEFLRKSEYDEVYDCPEWPCQSPFLADSVHQIHEEINNVPQSVNSEAHKAEYFQSTVKEEGNEYEQNNQVYLDQPICLDSGRHQIHNDDVPQESQNEGHGGNQGCQRSPEDSVHPDALETGIELTVLHKPRTRNKRRAIGEQTFYVKIARCIAVTVVIAIVLVCAIIFTSK